MAREAQEQNWQRAVEALRRAERVVVFSGAGISAESGIPTFRDADGFWERFPPEEFATWEGLGRKARKNPHQLIEFAWNVLAPIARARPNAAHRAVAQLERSVSTEVITQNIDGLHQVAGSSRVYEIHGSIREVVNTSNGKLVKKFTQEELLQMAELMERYLDQQLGMWSLLRKMGRYYPIDLRGRNRPNLVLFGAQMAEPDWEQAQQAARQCDLFLLIGTSGMVYPAAMLPEEATAAGATLITIDPHPQAGHWLSGQAGELLPNLVQAAFG